MNISDKINYSPQRYFCWQDTWHLPFESMGSVLEKFKFANEIDARIAKNFYKNDNEFNNLISNKLLYYEEVVKKEYLWFLLEHSNVRIEQIFKSQFTFCLECMKVGYHSLLHQLETFKTCLFHNQVLMDCCPSCYKTFRYNDPHYFGIPYECTCGFKFHRVNHNFMEIWPQTKFINDNFKENWRLLREDNSSSRYKLLFPNNYNQKEGIFCDIYRLNQGLETIFSKGFAQIPDNLVMIKKQRKIFKEKYYLPLIEEYSKAINHDCTLYMEVVSKDRRDALLKHFDLYIDSKQVFKSICRFVRKKILKKHKNCIKNFPKMVQTKKICQYALLYIFWRSYLERGIEGLYDKWDRTEQRPSHHIKEVKLEYFSLYWKDPFQIISQDILDFARINLTTDYLLIRWIINYYLAIVMVDLLKQGITDIQSNITPPFRGVGQCVPFMFFLFPQNSSSDTNNYLFTKHLSITGIIAKTTDFKCSYNKKEVYKSYINPMKNSIEVAFD